MQLAAFICKCIHIKVLIKGLVIDLGGVSKNNDTYHVHDIKSNKAAVFKSSFSLGANLPPPPGDSIFQEELMQYQ